MQVQQTGDAFANVPICSFFFLKLKAQAQEINAENKKTMSKIDRFASLSEKFQAQLQKNKAEFDQKLGKVIAFWLLLHLTPPFSKPQLQTDAKKKQKELPKLTDNYKKNTMKLEESFLKEMRHIAAELMERRQFNDHFLEKWDFCDKVHRFFIPRFPHPFSSIAFFQDQHGHFQCLGRV